MKAKYQRYYDKLHGVNLSSGQSNLSNALGSAKSNIVSVKSALSSSSYTELAAMTINNSTLPGIQACIEKVESSATSAISSVISGVASLVSMLDELKSIEDTLDSLGGSWSYSESRSKSEVDRHNNKIKEYQEKESKQEAAIDGQIASINGITVDAVDVVSICAGKMDTSMEDKPLSDEKEPETDGDVTVETKDGEEVEKIKSDGTLYSDGSKKYSIPSDPVIAAKKAEFLGDYNDPNNYTHFTGTRYQMTSRKNKLQLFDNTTGEIVDYLGEIDMKVGETRVITVKLPSDTGKINRITRTTASGSDEYKKGNVVKARCDIDPDPNNIDYVFIAEAKKGSEHYPSDMSLLQNNSYDWVIKAVGPGRVSITQTTLWESEDSGKYNLKAMSEIYVNVKDDNQSDDNSKKKK
jgi:hypothetical protein